MKTALPLSFHPPATGARGSEHQIRLGRTLIEHVEKIPWQVSTYVSKTKLLIGSACLKRLKCEEI